jgi:hypothetical protein
MRDKNWGLKNVMTGKAGEHAVASQLFLRGMPVMFPGLDLGVDLVAHNGCRIQVKSAHLCATEKMLEQYGRGSYFFPLLREKRRAVTNSVSRMVPRTPFEDACDIVVLWGIEENKFWVVPSSLAGRSTGLCLGDNDPGRFVGSVSDIKKLKEQGCGVTEIARRYGIDRTTVHNLLKSTKEFQGPSITSQVRQCENAWDHILNFTPAISQPGEVVPFEERVLV